MEPMKMAEQNQNILEGLFSLNAIDDPPLEIRGDEHPEIVEESGEGDEEAKR
jgi:hypothetical protein